VLCLDKIGGLEPFREPLVDGPNQRTGPRHSSPVLPQAAQAHGDAQFQRLAGLGSRDLKRTLKPFLRGIGGHSPEEMEFCRPPHVAVLRGSRQRRVDDGARLVWLPGGYERFRQ
jgi:hypothetical protein